MSNHPYTEAGRPSTLSAAHTLLILGGLVEVVQCVMLGVHLRDVANQNAAQDMFSSGASDGGGLLVGAVIGGLIFGGVWLWMAWGNGTGRPWARIVATILCLIDTLFVFAGLAMSGAGAFKVTSTLMWLLGASALVLMWLRPSSRFYHRFAAIRPVAPVPGTADAPWADASLRRPPRGAAL